MAVDTLNPNIARRFRGKGRPISGSRFFGLQNRYGYTGRLRANGVLPSLLPKNRPNPHSTGFGESFKSTIAGKRRPVIPPYKVAVEAIVDEDVAAVSEVCRVLGVNRTSYYAWKTSEPTVCEEQDAQLSPLVRVLFKETSSSLRGSKDWPRSARWDTDAATKRSRKS